MVEKPFGYDTASAQELIHRLKQSFEEDQIYRIDHYLAKETAQNILIFRFTNPIFGRLWDRHSISRLRLTAGETIGIEGRVAFYEHVGALRDFIQNHLIQLLAITTMEEPAAMSSHDIHAEKLRLLQSISPIPADQVATRATRGQYRSYRAEVNNPDSKTETFARLELEIANDRWRGVPITLQTGKALDRKTTEIVVEFADNPSDPRHPDAAPNLLIFRIQPDEGIVIDLLAKKPGFEHQTERVEMAFDYHHSFGAGTHPDAYERVLMDGIRGDQTLFASSAEVLAAWQVVENVVQEWSKSGEGLIVYEPGSTPNEIIAHHT
jgi:glucose-6-phosphate 1-dehydrogenase